MTAKVTRPKSYSRNTLNSIKLYLMNYGQNAQPPTTIFVYSANRQMLNTVLYYKQQEKENLNKPERKRTMKTLILALTILSAISTTNRTEYYSRYGTVIRHNRNSGLTTVKDKQGMVWRYFSDIPVQTGKKVKMTMYTNKTTDSLDDWVVDVEW